MVAALKAANTNGMFVDGLALGGIDRPRDPAPDRRLTDREREILTLMSGGLNPKAHRQRTGISVGTVRGHVKSIMAKLGAHTQLEAVVIAPEGLTSPSPLPDVSPGAAGHFAQVELFGHTSTSEALCGDCRLYDALGGAANVTKEAR